MARNIGVTFNGKRIVHAGAYSRLNADALNTLGTLTARKLIFLGTSEGGQPDTIHWFSNPSDARDVLRGGDLLQAGELAWNPSNDGVGAGTIGFLRVTPATQAQFVQDSMTIKSKDYGVWNNQIQIKLENGATSGTKKLTVYNWLDNFSEVYDDIGAIFTIQYTGSAAYADITITTDGTSGKATTLTLRTGADQGSATTVKTYTLGAGVYNDINVLVSDINDHVDFVATMKPTGNHNITTDALDAVANQDIKTATYNVMALKGDILYQTQYSSLVAISFASGTFPTNFAYTNLAGAVDGTTPSSWASKLDMLYGQGVYLIVPLTPDQAIHQECNNFIVSQADLERAPIVGVYGGASGESIETTIQRVTTLNSKRAILTYPEVKIQNTSGVTTLPPYMTSALVAGRIAGKATGDPITLDAVNIVGLGKTLKSADRDRLLEAGVTFIEFYRDSTGTGHRIAQGLTTYQQDSNPSFREISMVIIADEISTELTELLEKKFAGGRGTISSAGLIRNEVQSYLDRKVRQEVLVEYIPESVLVRIEGEVVYVDYSAMPAGAINYILITTTYYQKSLTA